ncbi:MAG: iron-siderophore ABC transporter substrate-binding protein [Dehalococcoidia bacterium]
MLTIVPIMAGMVLAGCGEDEKQQAASSPETGSRVVRHSMGETTVPTKPARVVTLDPFALEACLALGVPVVGTIMTADLDSRPFLTGKLDGVANLGTPGQVDLERTLGVGPDLILGTQGHAESYPRLSQIAPTVLAEAAGSGQWKEIFAKFAEALGKTAEAKQVMTRYDARIADLQAKLGDRLEETTVSIVRANIDVITIYLSESFPGTIIDDVGLPRPPAQTAAAFGAQISRERFREADASVIFLWSYGATSQIAKDAQTVLQNLETDPLWQQLHAVQQGRVYEVPAYWIGSGILAANAVLDDLDRYLVER